MKGRTVQLRAKAMSWKGVLIGGMTLMMVAALFVYLESGARGQGVSGDISATVSPGRIPLDKMAMLRVTVTGRDVAPPRIPDIEGLRLYPAGQSRSYASINGRVSSRTSYLYMVQAQNAGDFVIPAIQIEINGRPVRSAPITLTVVNAGAAARQSQASPQPARQSPRPHIDPHINQARAGRVAFMEITPLKNRVFVGEEIPVEINAYFRQGIDATLTSLPTLESPAFSCQGFSEKPAQTECRLGRRPYTVLTWHTAISPVKEGEYPLKVALDATVMVPDTTFRRRSPFGDGFFDDAFFDRFFSHTTEKPIQLTSNDLQMTVLPLPVTGRPADFSGAVGRFKLSATAAPLKATVGDPMVLKTVITGTGNFDRVTPPSLNNTERLKTYTPSVTAVASGKKSFEQAIIPMDPGIDNIPAVTFSYFDTKAQAYKTLTSKPIPVKIAAAPSNAGKAAIQTAKTTLPKPSHEEAQAPPANQYPTNALAPVAVDRGTVVSDIKPLAKNPWFLGAQGIPLGVMVFGLFLGRRNHRRIKDPKAYQHRASKQHIARGMSEMNRAITSHDVPAFFKAGRDAAQQCLSEQWGLQPQSITLKDLKERLSRERGGLCRLFECADAATYSGRSFTQEELTRIRDTIRTELMALHEKEAQK